MGFTDYKVTMIRYLHGEYRLKEPAQIIDEGSYYQIAGAHFIHKNSIEYAILEGNELTMFMEDRTVVLKVVQETNKIDEVRNTVPSVPQYQESEEWVQKHKEQFGEEPGFM